jgi:predicted acylesterase/phospholipase RssA
MKHNNLPHFLKKIKLQLYDMTGKELCVIITSLNSQNEEYCHPKITPDLKIRNAVRMSMSIPGGSTLINGINV